MGRTNDQMRTTLGEGKTGSVGVISRTLSLLWNLSLLQLRRWAAAAVRSRGMQISVALRTVEFVLNSANANDVLSQASTCGNPSGEMAKEDQAAHTH